MMTETLEDLIVRLVPYVSGDVVVTSAALAGGREVVIRQMERVRALKPETIVEVGTKDSVMAALLSRVAECVITFDVQRSPLLDDVLAVADARNVAALRLSDRQRGMVLERLEFDLAFIDGGPHHDQVASAFADTRRCGRVLFHGYGDPRREGLTRFVDSLTKGTVEHDPPFVWWRGEKAGFTF